MGPFDFLMSLVPDSFQWFVTFMGFQSDRKGSFVLLEQSWKSGCTRSVNAALILHWLNFVLLDNCLKSDQILSELEKKYPTSALIWITDGFYRQLNGQMDLSLAAFEQTIVSSSEIRWTQLFTIYMKGERYFVPKILSKSIFDLSEIALVIIWCASGQRHKS